MTTTTRPAPATGFTVTQHLGHALGLLLSVGNVVIGLSPGAREGDGYAGNVWVAFVVLGAVGAVALVASWVTRAGAPRRIAGVALVLVGLASLGFLLVPDIGAPGRIANSVGALLQLGAAAMVLLPGRGARDGS